MSTINALVDETIIETEPAETCGTVDTIVQEKISSRIRELRDFFNTADLITEKGDHKTNVINVLERKTYHVPDIRIEEFFTIFDSCRKEKRSLHISERQENARSLKSGIMIDFDRYQRTKDRQFNNDHFSSLNRAILRIVRDSLDFGPVWQGGKFCFHIFYISKPAVVLQASKVPGAPPLYKDGFHILMPELQVTKGYKKYLNQELIDRGHLNTIFKGMDHIDGASKMLDKMSASAPVYFLGSSTPGKEAYVLSHATRMTIFEDDAGSSEGLVFKVEDIPAEHNLAYELSLSFYTPTFDGRPTWLRKCQIDHLSALDQKIQVMMEKSSSDILPDDEVAAVDNSVDILTVGNAEAGYLKTLLGILDISYADNYEKWFKVICAIAHTSLNYKPLAIWFSMRKPEQWSSAEVERVWLEATNNKFNRRPVTIESIRLWARESSPQKYAEADKNHYLKLLLKKTYENEGRIGHSTVSCLIQIMIGGRYITDVGYNEKSSRSGQYYIFFEFVTPGQKMEKGQIYKWRKETKPDNIHLFIADHLPKVYAQVAENIKNRKQAAQNTAEIKYWTGVEKNFKLSKANLDNNKFQDDAITQCQYRLRERGFCDELDTDEDIIGVGNGVLKLGAVPELIRGHHPYRVSKYTPVDYIPYDANNPAIQILERAFQDIYPEEDVYEFMMYHASTGLDNKEAACMLVMEVGGGRNGKSFKAKIMHNTLRGQYSASGKSALLTAPTERGNEANSAQMQMRGKRYFYFDEFNKCEVLNTQRLKAIVSPQYQSGRDLHERQVNFKNTCNPICLSNFDFIIDTTDHGTWRRIKYYKNKVRFCENPSPNNPYEKKVDHRFIDEYANNPIYQEAMLSILVHWYSKLCKNYHGDIKLVPTPTIDAETEAFRNRQDTLNRFLTENVVRTPSQEVIAIPSFTIRYSDWYFRTFKQPYKHVDNLLAQLENSRVGQYIERLGSGVYYLRGHRILETPEEALKTGESYLLTIAAPEVKVKKYSAPVEVTVLPADRDNSHDFVSDLTKTSPVIIDNIGDIEDILNDVLGDEFKSQ